MFKKLGTAALAASMALLGFQASPALADPLDAASDAVIEQSTNFYYNLTSETFDLPSGVSNANINKSWNIRGEDLAGEAGKTLSLVGSITRPDGTSMEITPANLMGSLSVNINLNTSNGPVSTNWNSTSLVVPEATVTSGSANVSFYLGGFNMNNERETVAAGTYTVNASIKLGADLVTSGTNWGDPWYLQSNSYNYSLKGASITAPAGSGSGSFSAYVCVDSTKIAAGDALTAKGFVNGTEESSPDASWEWRGSGNMNSWRQAPNGMNTTTVVADDVTNGLSARVYFSSPVTAGSTYASSFQILNQNNESVTGSCAPSQPAKPTITFTNGAVTVSGLVPSFADNMSSDCQLFDAAAPTVVVATKSNVYAMNGSFSCNFSQGLVTGKSYFAQVRGGYKSVVDGPWSVSSDSVMKTAAGVSFTTPPSGINNAGGKLSLVSATIPSDADATSILSTSDGGNGIFTVATNSVLDGGGGTQVTGYAVRHITATGVDTSFAGTGSLTVTPGEFDFLSNGRFGWYGARDKFAFVVSNFPMMGNSSPELQIFTGSWASAGVTKTTVASSVLNEACVSTLGAGYSSIQSGGMMAPPYVGASMISAATDTPLLAVSCFKMSMIGGAPYTLSIPVLMTVTNSTTVNVVKALGTPSASVNTATYSVSVNPSAGANDAAVTILARTALQTSISEQTTDARTIYTIKKDLTVSTSTATWTSLVSEPSIRIAPNNDGTIWGFLQEGTSFRMFKLVGDAFTTTNVTVDANADFAANSISIPNGLQAGNSALLTVSRSTAGPSGVVLAQATVDTATGVMTTYEVAKYTFTTGTGALTATFVDSKNLYWVHTNTADGTKYSIYRWRDPAYVAQAAADQTITWTTIPTSMAAGGTTTVAATASSNLAVSYSSTDATKCTVNESTGVVTAVATSGICTIKANQAGNDAFKAAPQKLHVINIAAVVPVKKAPRVPTIATKVKAGKTFSIALHATKGTAKTAANLDGLVTKVVLASSSKGYCSITPVIKSKKIAGYTVKGLKVNATKCAVTITITGNATFNTLTKTVKVNVTK
jgi:hypothetical protein